MHIVYRAYCWCADEYIVVLFTDEHIVVCMHEHTVMCQLSIVVCAIIIMLCVRMHAVLCVVFGYHWKQTIILLTLPASSFLNCFNAI